MAKETIYYNAPAGLFTEALLNGNKQALDDILNVAVVSFTKANSGATFKQAQEKLCFTGGIESDVLSRGNSALGRYNGSPFFGIEKDTYWRFRDNTQSEEQCVLLIAYLALRSILKERPFTNIKNDFWLSRMSGFSGLAPEKEVPDKTEKAIRDIRRKVKGGGYDYVKEEYTKVISKKKVRDYHPTIAKYSSHYHLQHIKNLLYEYYHVASYSKTRGTYFSLVLTLEKLIEKVYEIREKKEGSALETETSVIEERIKARMKNKG